MIEIPLVTRVKISDGGKKDGLGSLSAYRVCLLLHSHFRRVE